MIKHTGPGQIEQTEHPSRLMLFNFDIDGARLKPEHERALRTAVIPKLQTGGSVSIVGLASRTGGHHHNQRISDQRADNVRRFLRGEVPEGFAIRQYLAFGDRKARLDGVPRGTEDERYRCVLLYPATGPSPPVPKIDNATVREVIPDISSDGGILDSIGQILDVSSGLASLLNVVLDAILVDLAGTVLGVISTIIGLPAAWLSGNAVAERNAKRQGFAKAIDAMSEPFDGNDAAKWPPVPPHPIPKFSQPDQFVTLAERSARTGLRQGYELAWSLIMQLEKSPKIVDAKLKGKAIKIKVSGRMFLWLMRRAYGEDVWRNILRQLGGYAD
jgi:hypothetical protein